jgi:hypothetical protein
MRQEGLGRLTRRLPVAVEVAQKAAALAVRGVVLPEGQQMAGEILLHGIGQ